MQGPMPSCSSSSVSSISSLLCSTSAIMNQLARARQDVSNVSAPRMSGHHGTTVSDSTSRYCRAHSSDGEKKKRCVNQGGYECICHGSRAAMGRAKGVGGGIELAELVGHLYDAAALTFYPATETLSRTHVRRRRRHGSRLHRPRPWPCS